jgi:hypothetical protein
MSIRVFIQCLFFPNPDDLLVAFDPGAFSSRLPLGEIIFPLMEMQQFLTAETH